MTYNIELSHHAHKALKNIPRADLKKIGNKIEKLKKNPLPSGCEKLEGNDDLYRIRSGDYRIIYQIFNKKLIIFVIKIGHRREVYR